MSKLKIPRMKIEAMTTGAVLCAIFAFLLFVGCEAEEISCVVPARNGVEVIISIRVSDDSAVDYVSGKIVKEGEVVVDRIPLGLTQGEVNCSSLQLYMSGNGRIIGLFERVNPLMLLMVADFDENLAFPSRGSHSKTEVSRMLGILSEDSELKLEYGGSFFFSKSQFLHSP